MTPRERELDSPRIVLRKTQWIGLPMMAAIPLLALFGARMSRASPTCA